MRWNGQRRAMLLALAVLAAVMLTVIGEIPVPLRPNNTWTMRELGGARQLVGGAWQVPTRPWLELLLRGIGLMASAVAVVAVVRRGDPGRADPSAVRAAVVMVAAGDRRVDRRRGVGRGRPSSSTWPPTSCWSTCCGSTTTATC